MVFATNPVTVPENTTVVQTHKKVLLVNQQTGEIEESTALRCVGSKEYNILNVNAIGNNTEIEYIPSRIAEGVNSRAVHEFNVQSGWCEPDADTAERRAAESKRTSISRSAGTIRLLVANNPWNYFFTITLSPEKWDRKNPVEVQSCIKEFAKRIQRKQNNKQKMYKDFKYLLIPEAHADGSIHFHGFLFHLPDEMLMEYTMTDINGSKPIPQYIVDKVQAGETLYHCPDWDELFGYNLLEPIIDQDRAASYVTKYVSKDIGKLNFPTRYWCSRGLNKKITVYSQCISKSPDCNSAILSAVRKDFIELASTKHKKDGSEEKLYAESFVSIPLSGRDSDSKYLSSISAVVDKKDMSRSDVIKHLQDRFPERSDEK